MPSVFTHLAPGAPLTCNAAGRPASPPSHMRSTRRPVRTWDMDRRLLILALGMFAMGTDNFVVAGILPGVAASLHTSVSLAGLMVTFYALTYALAAPVMAAVAGSLPRKLLLVSALGIFVVGNAVSALATDFSWVLISRAVAGFGAALFAPTALGVASA